MKRWLMVVAGGVGGLFAGLLLFVVITKVGDAVGFGDPSGSGGTSIAGAIGFLGLWVSMVGGAFLGYKTCSPGPDPEQLRESRGYYRWLRAYKEGRE